MNWVKSSFEANKPKGPVKEKIVQANFKCLVYEPLPQNSGNFKRKSLPLFIQFNGVQVEKKKQNKYDKILPENQAKLRMYASMSSLAIIGTPEEIGEALNFSKMRENQVIISNKILRTLKGE